ncbi:predicted protein [Nematostella vectensis]|uniref:Uncharacterized protein n=1 Tax=Nematostella vectensis TaxID=45351 RepID=A7SJR4_NEMVE|nr:predicted protein [Nematostella vectensis]|eukprot:XP_001628099.1 predicted protein [Nematostella vectensis]
MLKRNLEEKKKQKEAAEERERAAILAERHNQKEEATRKFQKDGLKKKTPPESSVHSNTDSQQSQHSDGRISQLQNGVIPTVPALEDALELINNPEAFDNYMHYRSQFIAPSSDNSLGRSHYGQGYEMNNGYGLCETGRGLGKTGYGPDNPVYDIGYNGPGQMNTGYGPVTAGYPGNYSQHYNEQAYHLQNNNVCIEDENAQKREEEERLRQDVIHNAAPKLAFMDDNDECTDGALPSTMGHESPAGSLTSLDSLDEVPPDATTTSKRLTQKPTTPVTGIINKRSKVASAGRRKVTFSDSIEFDDGLTGQLVTIEKESCKNYVNLYNSRIAAANAAQNTVPPVVSGPGVATPAAQAASKAVSGIQGQSLNVVGRPDNKNNNSVHSPSPGKSTSMVVPKSVYSQIKPQNDEKGAKKQPPAPMHVVTCGESTPSAVTHTERPLQGIAAPHPTSRAAYITNSPQVTTTNAAYGFNRGTAPQMPSTTIGGRHDQAGGGGGIPPNAYYGHLSSLNIADQRGRAHQYQLFEGPPMQSPGSNTAQQGTKVENAENHRHEMKHQDSIALTSERYNSTNHNKGLNDSLEQEDSPEGVSPDSVDSLDNMCDSLDDEESDTCEYEKEAVNGQIVNMMNGKQGEVLKEDNPDSPRSVETADSGIDYYGKPAIIYHHPFGGKITNTHQPHAYTIEPRDSGLTTLSGKAKPPDQPAKSDGALGQLAEDPRSRVGTQQMAINVGHADPAFEGVALSGLAPTNLESHSTPTQPSYYRSWYSGSFFPNRKDNATSLQEGQLVSTGNTHTKSKVGSAKAEKAPSSDSKSPYIAKPPAKGPNGQRPANRSQLQRKRAAAAAQRAKVAQTKTRKPASQQTKARLEGTRSQGTPSTKHNSPYKAPYESNSDDDEFIKNIRRNMESITLRTTPSPAAEEYRRVMESISRPKANTRLETPDSQRCDDDQISVDHAAELKAKGTGAAVKIHPPRIASARPRIPRPSQANVNTPGEVIPQGKPPVPIGRHTHEVSPHAFHDQSSPYSNQSLVYQRHGVNSHVPSNHTNEGYSGSEMYGAHGWTNNTAYPPYGQSTKQSIRLDKTPTDDEINVLWDRVRLCLDHKDSKSVGSDSCVNRVDVRRSRTASGPFPHTGERGSRPDNGHCHTTPSSNGTVGGLRRYGSYEVLRRHGSADNIGYRRPLLQHRAQRVRTSSQQYPSPSSSRKGPANTVSARAVQPLSQTEVRAVLHASERTLEDPGHAQRAQYQALIGGRRGPSALSIEEQRLMQSLDRLNERLKVQAAKLSEATGKNEHRTQSIFDTLYK